MALVPLLCACAKTSDARTAEVTEFTLHECKRAGASGSLATGRETADYVGLECVAWRLDGDRADIDLINRLEGCGLGGSEPAETLWTPALQQTSSDALMYSVSWESDKVAACGSCLHDFSVAAKGLALSDTALHLSIETRTCNHDCDWTRDTLDIPAAQSGEGIRCRYVDWNHAAFAANSYGGKLGGPAYNGGCDEGLVASAINGATVCLKACASDDDCRAPLTTCEAGGCRLSDPW